MRAHQARCSVEIARDIQNDKSLKSKAEKERRLREKHSNNTKIFIDERRTAAMKHEKRREKLRKLHENQMNDLLIYMQSVRTRESEQSGSQKNVFKNDMIGEPKAFRPC